MLTTIALALLATASAAVRCVALAMMAVFGIVIIVVGTDPRYVRDARPAAQDDNDC